MIDTFENKLSALFDWFDKHETLRAVTGLLLFIGFITLGMYMAQDDDRTMYKEVKNGEVSLVCNIDGFFTKIDPKLVSGYSSEIKGGTWLFTNGYAKNCLLQRNQTP